MSKSPPPSITAFLAAGLALLTLVLFWPVLSHDFVHYDDPLYVTANAHTQAGLLWENVKWSFAHLVGNKTYWHPLTWLSHMLDCQIFGLKAGAHHFTSLLFHVANSVLLLLVLKKLTGAVWKSALVAALFAWHPLQVDTVAWIAERKNLLGTLFSLLTIWAYAHYAERKTQNSKLRTAFYFLALFLFALALMSKGPLAVTVPCLLLVLDFWPLHRMINDSAVTAAEIQNAKLKTQNWFYLLWEKLPFFALSAVSSAITVAAHQQLGLIIGGEQLPWLTRLTNGFVAYLFYLGHIFWPARLAVYYPPQAHSPWLTGTALLLIVGFSLLIFWKAKRAPYIFAGWFWLLGTLVPFIGFVQAGVQAMADRFVYFPIIGFFLGFVWLASAWAKNRLGKNVKAALSVLLLLGCLITTRLQLAHWQNTVTLFAHAAAVTKNNDTAHVNLGSAWLEKGETNAAVQNYRAAIAINPHSREAHYFLAKILANQGEIQEAGQELTAVLEIDPNHVHARNDLGILLMKIGRLDEAADEFARAIQSDAQFAEAHYNLGIALSEQKKTDEAIARYQQALKIKPDYADALNNLAALLLLKKEIAPAVAYLQKAVALQPNDAEAHFNLSIALGKLGKTNEAKQHYEIGARLRPDLLRK